MAVLRNPYEKRLDKSLQSWYNNRVKERKAVLSVDDYIKTNSVNKAVSAINKDTIVKLGEAVLATCSQERYNNLRPPVIAGGAVRDTVFGLTPKDYDIFVDTSDVGVDDGEREDFVLLFLNDLVDEVNKRDEALRGRLQNAHIRPLVGNYTSDNAKPDFVEEKKFTVYETAWADDVEWPMLPLQVQLIGRVDPRLTDNPVEFLDEFDYPAVRCLYDPFVSKFEFTGDFRSMLETKRIEVKDDTTYRRVSEFLMRFRYGGNGTVPLQMLDTRPKKTLKTLGDILSSNTAPINIMDNDWAREFFRAVER